MGAIYYDIIQVCHETTQKIVLLDSETTDKQCLLKPYLVSFYLCILLSSLEWDGYIWNGIGDEGALALADHRVMRNIKKLKSVPLHGQADCFYIFPFVYLSIVIIVVMWNGGLWW